MSPTSMPAPAATNSAAAEFRAYATKIASQPTIKPFGTHSAT
ncbi:MAG: hypothetical protein ACXVHB_03875 [Solirubrobacteraceae bacterium]